MTINHRAEAEKHASRAAFTNGYGHPSDPIASDFHLRMAQVHATLAATQATTADASSYRAALTAWRGIVAHFVAWGLMHADTDDAHANWRDLAQSLDEAGLNIDHDVDAIIPTIDGDPRVVWDPPTVRRAKADVDPPF